MNAPPAKQVLSVGQCMLDHSAISRVLEAQFSAVVDYAPDVDSALAVMREQPYALVLVNRILDQTLEEGTDLIRKAKQDDQLRALPIMLVSNFEAAQQEAAALGAVPGFGKADLEAPATRDLLATYLQ